MYHTLYVILVASNLFSHQNVIVVPVLVLLDFVNIQVCHWITFSVSYCLIQWLLFRKSLHALHATTHMCIEFDNEGEQQATDKVDE